MRYSENVPTFHVGQEVWHYDGRTPTEATIVEISSFAYEGIRIEINGRKQQTIREYLWARPEEKDSLIGEIREDASDLDRWADRLEQGS